MTDIFEILVKPALAIYVQLPSADENAIREGAGIAQYVGGVYGFALLIAGITAFGVIIFAAIEYVISAGKPSLRSDALDRITQAIFGLILLFAAYLILNTINPSLVQLGASEERLQRILPSLESPAPTTTTRLPINILEPQVFNVLGTSEERASGARDADIYLSECISRGGTSRGGTLIQNCVQQDQSSNLCRTVQLTCTDL